MLYISSIHYANKHKNWYVINVFNFGANPVGTSITSARLIVGSDKELFVVVSTQKSKCLHFCVSLFYVVTEDILIIKANAIRPAWQRHFACMQGPIVNKTWISDSHKGTVNYL